MKLGFKLFVASASMLASAMFSGAPAVQAAPVNYVIAFTGTATINNGDGTCGNAVCWNGGSGTYQFLGAKKCVAAYPANASCDVTLTTGSFVSKACGTGTATGDPNTASVTVNGSSHGVTDYQITFVAGNGVLRGHLDDGSTFNGAVNISPADSNGKGVEAPTTGPGNGACTNGFNVAATAVN